MIKFAIISFAIILLVSGITFLYLALQDKGDHY
jgi:hypothetical protein